MQYRLRHRPYWVHEAMSDHAQSPPSSTDYESVGQTPVEREAIGVSRTHSSPTKPHPEELLQDLISRPSRPARVPRVISYCPIWDGE